MLNDTVVAEYRTEFYQHLKYSHKRGIIVLVTQHANIWDSFQIWRTELADLELFSFLS